MKNICIAAIVLMSTVSFAQEIEPKYEIQGNLVKATYYHANGNIKQEGFYKDGKVHGQWVSYNESGEKLSLGEYTDGKKSGKWFFWNQASLNEVDYLNSRVATINKWEKQLVAQQAVKK